jgi:hypothetical protein
MSPVQDDYFDALELSDVLRERIVRLQLIAASVNPEAIGAVFVSNYVSEDGVTVYENLWFMSPHFMMECKGFQLKDDIDMGVVWKAVRYWNATMSDFDLAEATPQSRMTLNCQLDGPIALDLRASGRNCEYLAEILRTYVVPNVAV